MVQISTSAKSSGGTKLPYKVASSIAPIPGKLVSRIQALKFMEMRELLPDNIALAERLATLPAGLAPPKPPGEREISGDKALMTWVSSFATYIAIVGEVHPNRVGNMLAYMRLIVHEAGKFGGNGWLTYDSVPQKSGGTVNTIELYRLLPALGVRSQPAGVGGSAVQALPGD